jgi:hypothetical protein
MSDDLVTRLPAMMVKPCPTPTACKFHGECLASDDLVTRLREALAQADELAAQVNREGATMSGHVMLELKRYMTIRAALTLPYKEEKDD